MKKFAFSLQRILGFKRTMYEKECNTLAQLRAERLGVERRQEATRTQMLLRDEDFRQKAAHGGVDIFEVNRNSFYRENAESLIEQLQLQLNALDVEIEKQLVVVVELDKEVKSLEKLRERHWEEYLAEAAKEESERILELVSREFVEAQAEATEEEEQALQRAENA